MDTVIPVREIYKAILYMEDKLKEIFYNPETGLISANKLFQKVKKDGYTRKQVDDFVKKQTTAQMHKPVVKEQVFFPITSYEPNEHLQLDLMDISNVSTTNSYYKYLFVSIDIFTRKALVIPLKFKSTEHIIAAMEPIIHTFKPKIVSTDSGSEYISYAFNDYLKRHNVEHRYIDVEQHASLGIVDRFCRTLRGLINKFCTSHKTTRFIDALPKLVENYNNTYHSTIKCTPNEAHNNVDEINEIMLMKYMLAKAKEKVFNIGDKVRYLENLTIFQKQGLSKWSNFVYTITGKKTHSYQLSNGKWYRYYQLLLVPEETEDVKKVGRPTKHTAQTLRKENTVKRKLKHEDINLSNVIKTKRLRQKTDRFSY